MIISGVQLADLDLADLETAERFEEEFLKCSNRIKKIKGTRVEIIREDCCAVFELFDNLFGDGTSKKIFGEKTNIILCNKALSELVDEAHKIDERNAWITNEIYEKYNPDRAER